MTKRVGGRAVVVDKQHGRRTCESLGFEFFDIFEFIVNYQNNPRCTDRPKYKRFILVFSLGSGGGSGGKMGEGVKGLMRTMERRNHRMLSYA